MVVCGLMLPSLPLFGWLDESFESWCSRTLTAGDSRKALRQAKFAHYPVNLMQPSGLLYSPEVLRSFYELHQQSEIMSVRFVMGKGFSLWCKAGHAWPRIPGFACSGTAAPRGLFIQARGSSSVLATVGPAALINCSCARHATHRLCDPSTKAMGVNGDVHNLTAQCLKKGEYDEDREATAQYSRGSALYPCSLCAIASLKHSNLPTAFPAQTASKNKQ